MLDLPAADGPLDRPRSCPCGSGARYDDCCGPLLRNERVADGIEELMRSRYTAYVLGDIDHLFRTWHPRTRPEDLAPDEGLTWTGLEVLAVDEHDADEGSADEGSADEGRVTFRAHWTWSGQAGALHERSRFVRRAGRWVYVDGETL